MRKLIVNADDFGFNREVTDGIIQCHQRGCVTSTTLMVNMSAAEYAAEQAKKFPNLSVGIHLNLTHGRPISDPQKVPALVGADSNFNKERNVYKRANRFQLPAEQIERELSAQIEKFLDLGISPSHCDSHHRIGAWLQIFPIQLRLLKKYGIRRLRTHGGLYHFDKTASKKFKALLRMLKVNARKLPNNAYYKLQDVYCRLNGFVLPDIRYSFVKLISSSPLKFDIAGWQKLIKNMPSGTVELTTHPGLPNDDPMDKPAFREQRVAEYNLLINPECKRICQEHGIELISFNEL